MFWKVKTDHISNGDQFDRTGHCVGHMPDGAKLYTAKLYDDDGELYYTVVYDAEAFEEDDNPEGLYGCYNWAMNDAGVTDLRVKLEDIVILWPNMAEMNRKIARKDGWVSVYG